MKRFATTTFDLVISAACATITAVAMLPFSLIATAIFLFVTFLRTRSRIRLGQVRLATANCLASVLLFCGLVVAAATYRPAKIVEQLLDREITLTSTKITLAELSYAASYDRTAFPFHTWFCFAEDDQDTIIEFPGHHLTIRELLNSVETQTALRRRFLHCGIGYTVLGGGDCCFGLYIRDPELAVPPFSPRERFDVDVYARERDRQITKR